MWSASALSCHRPELLTGNWIAHCGQMFRVTLPRGAQLEYEIPQFAHVLCARRGCPIGIPCDRLSSLGLSMACNADMLGRNLRDALHFSVMPFKGPK